MIDTLLTLVLIAICSKGWAACNAEDSLCDFINSYQKEKLSFSLEQGADRWAIGLWRNRKFTGGSYGDTTGFPILGNFLQNTSVKKAARELSSLAGVVAKSDIDYISGLYAYDIYINVGGSQVTKNKNYVSQANLKLWNKHVLPCLKIDPPSVCGDLSRLGIIEEKGSRFSIASAIKSNQESPLLVNQKLLQFDKKLIDQRETERLESLNETNKKKQEVKTKLNKGEGKYSYSTKNGEKQCKIPKRTSICKTKDFTRIRATESFKNNYKSRFGNLNEKLKKYCVSAFVSKKSKAYNKAYPQIKRSLQMKSEDFDFYGCKADFVPGEEISCMEKIEKFSHGKDASKIMPIPYWPAGSSAFGFETWNASNFWNMQANGRIDCNVNDETVEKYLGWACVAENGFPDCFEKSNSIWDSFKSQ